MNIDVIQSLITTVGFPICCCVALGYFIFKVWNNLSDSANQREEKLYTILGDAQRQNKELSETNREFVEVLNAYKADLEDIKADVFEIKSKVTKGE